GDVNERAGFVESTQRSTCADPDALEASVISTTSRVAWSSSNFESWALSGRVTSEKTSLPTIPTGQPSAGAAGSTLAAPICVVGVPVAGPASSLPVPASAVVQATTSY